MIQMHSNHNFALRTRPLASGVCERSKPRRLLAGALACWMGLLPLCGCGLGNSPPNGGTNPSLPPATTPQQVSLTVPSISSFQPSSGAPFTLLAITGQNFNPNVLTDVTFSDGNGFSSTVSALLVNSTTLLAPVPPYFDSSGNFAT